MVLHKFSAVYVGYNQDDQWRRRLRSSSLGDVKTVSN